MSTYYHLLCNDCREKTEAASRTVGAFGNLGDSGQTLLPFIIAHSDHDIVSANEHTDELYDPDDEYIKWTEENIADMIEEAKADGRWR